MRRVGVLLLTVGLALCFRGLVSTSSPAPPPAAAVPSSVVEELWVEGAVTTASPVAVHDPTRTGSAPGSTPAALVSAAADLAVVTSEAVPGGCPGCLAALGWPRAEDQPIPGLPKLTGCGSVATRWSKRHQAPEGHWGATPPATCVCCSGPGHDHGDERRDVERAALMLLAFAANGQTHRYGPFKRTVSKALRWLRAQQEPQGWIGPRLDFVSAARNHTIAALALAELYAITRDPFLEHDVARALRVCQRGIAPRLGELPPATVGWLVKAAAVARLAKLPFDAITQERIAARTTLRTADARRLAIGVLAEVYLRRTPTSDRRLQRAGRRLVTRLPEWRPGAVDLETWLFASQALFQVGGAPWTSWSTRLRDTLIAANLRGGCADGSWDPIGRQGAAGGRAWTYAMACLNLEVHYRWERVQQLKAEGD